MPKILVADVRQAVDCEVVGPDDAEYDELRAVYNGLFDRRPGAIIRCRSSEDVASAVRFVSHRCVPFVIRAGGHSISGQSSIDDGVVIDLRPMSAVSADPDAHTARVQGGALLRDLDQATQEHGQATPSGAVSHTGAGGLTLGGGLGRLNRQFGLSIDNLLGAEVVSADGSIQWVDEANEPDLFWALRGGGGGNFGVVTEFLFRTHDVAEPYVGLIMHPASEAKAVLQRWRDTFAAGAPETLNWGIYFVLGSELTGAPPELIDKPMVTSIIEWYGDEADRHILNNLVSQLGGHAAVHGPMPYLAIQTIFDHVFTPGIRAWSKSGFFDTISDALIDQAIEEASGMLTPTSVFEMVPLGGAAACVPNDATAWAYRSAGFVLNVVACWHGEESDAVNIAWGRKAFDAMAPFRSGGAYLNYVGDEEAAADFEELFGNHLSRLREVKAKFDPHNLFGGRYSLAKR